MFSHKVGKRILAGHLGLNPMERNPPCTVIVEDETDRDQNLQRPKSGIVSMFRERPCLDLQEVSG